MQGKSLMILAGVTLVVVLAAVWSQLDRGGSGEEELPDRLLAGFEEAVNEAAVLEVTQSGERIQLARRGEEWVVPDKGEYPAKADEVVKVLRGMALLEPVERKTSNPAYFDELQVGEPGTEGAQSKRIRVTDDQGEVLADLVVGKQDRRGRRQVHYVRRQGEDQVWLVEGTLRLPFGSRGWMDTSVLKLPSSEIREVVVEHPDGETLRIFKESEEDTSFQVEGLPEGWELKYASVANSIGNAFNAVNFDDVQPAGSIDFEGAEKTTVRATTFEDSELVLELVQVEGSDWCRLRSDDEDLVGDASDWDFQLPTFKANALRKRMTDLADPPEEPEEEAEAGEEAGETEEPASPGEDVEDPDGFR